MQFGVLLAAAVVAGTVAVRLSGPAADFPRIGESAPAALETLAASPRSEGEAPACVVSKRAPEESEAVAEPVPELLPEPLPVSLAFLTRPMDLFEWPAPAEPMGRTFPLSVGQLEGPELRAECVDALYRRCAPHPFLDAGNALLKPPELILDEAVRLLGGGLARIRGQSSGGGEQPSITSLLLMLEIDWRQEPLFTQLLGHWTAQEQIYLARFVDSRASTLAFEERTEDVDLHELEIDQRKVLMDAVRRTYLARYKVQADERLREDAWYLDRWRGADVVVLPPLIGAYLYYRGLDKRFSLGPTSLHVSIEPLSEWVSRNRTYPVAAGLEWRVKGLPLALLVSSGVRDGRYEIDFVGIGTSLAPARRALLQLEGRRDR